MQERRRSKQTRRRTQMPLEQQPQDGSLLQLTPVSLAVQLESGLTHEWRSAGQQNMRSNRASTKDEAIRDCRLSCRRLALTPLDPFCAPSPHSCAPLRPVVAPAAVGCLRLECGWIRLQLLQRTRRLRAAAAIQPPPAQMHSSSRRSTVVERRPTRARLKRQQEHSRLSSKQQEQLEQLQLQRRQRRRWQSPVAAEA